MIHIIQFFFSNFRSKWFISNPSCKSFTTSLSTKTCHYMPLVSDLIRTKSVPSGRSLPPNNRNNAAFLKSQKNKRLARAKSIHIDRNIRLGQLKGTNCQVESRRSQRISVPVAHFNYGLVRCCVCKKSFRQDIPIELYAGKIVCSFECAKRQH